MAGHNQKKQNCRLCGKPQSVLELDAHLARCVASAAARYEPRKMAAEAKAANALERTESHKEKMRKAKRDADNRAAQQIAAALFAEMVAAANDLEVQNDDTYKAAKDPANIEETDEVAKDPANMDN